MHKIHTLGNSVKCAVPVHQDYHLTHTSGVLSIYYPHVLVLDSVPLLNRFGKRIHQCIADIVDKVSVSQVSMCLLII